MIHTMTDEVYEATALGKHHLLAFNEFGEEVMILRSIPFEKALSKEEEQVERVLPTLKAWYFDTESVSNTTLENNLRDLGRILQSEGFLK